MSYCYCIKTLRVDIERVSDDVFRIVDRSILAVDPNNLEEAQRQPYKLNIHTEAGEDVIVSINPGGSKMFSASNLGICELKDGCYCLSVESCDRVLEKKVGFFPWAQCMIDDMLIKNQDDDVWCECRDELERINILIEHGKSETAQLKYKRLCEKLRQCGVHAGRAV